MREHELTSSENFLIKKEALAGGCQGSSNGNRELRGPIAARNPIITPLRSPYIDLHQEPCDAAQAAVLNCPCAAARSRPPYFRGILLTAPE